ncbi:IPIL1 protein, partial [Crotophaga sulcirostris]|nr:IPIL1 protein [Crotophaga sulcirostris]
AQHLLLSFIHVISELSSNSFFPVLQQPIGVGSAFEGWSAREDDSIYCFLVPLKPPHGHTFNLELDTAGEMRARNFCIHVELVCTCTTKQQMEKMQCLLHQPKEHRRQNQALSLFNTLCTGPYLDVQKTAHWFSQKVEEVWKTWPQWFQYFVRMLPSDRSCKFQMTKDSEKIFTIEVIFGVQEGDSDIFLSSQMTGATSTPSTTWPESYAVAEVKFFKHMTRQASYNTCHLTCLQVCAYNLVGRSFSTYTIKTVVMHLMTIIPLSDQRWRDCLLMLLDVMQYLYCCLAEKRLNHFFFGNDNVPEEIVLPPYFQMVEPLNLFEYLAQDPHSHAEAQREFMVLRDR